MYYRSKKDIIVMFVVYCVLQMLLVIGAVGVGCLFFWLYQKVRA